MWFLLPVLLNQHAVDADGRLFSLEQACVVAIVFKTEQTAGDRPT